MKGSGVRWNEKWRQWITYNKKPLKVRAGTGLFHQGPEMSSGEEPKQSTEHVMNAFNILSLNIKIKKR